MLQNLDRETIFLKKQLNKFERKKKKIEEQMMQLLLHLADIIHKDKY
jgi:hypothetical protein